jgi:hypothetical protein
MDLGRAEAVLLGQTRDLFQIAHAQSGFLALSWRSKASLLGAVC